MNFMKLFDTLTLDGLEDFVARKQEESLHLDFKVPGDAALSSRDDRRNFARALSGFANSSGGLLVWGVDARKDPDGVDRAVAILPVGRVLLLLSRLNSLAGQAVDPTVSGVRNRALPLDDGTGYALTLVPESDTCPHMAKLGEDRYYKRSGDSFYKMEHYDLADMFGRRRKPRLTVTYRVEGALPKARLVMGLKNEGRASARSPFVVFHGDGIVRREPFGLDGNYQDGLPLIPTAAGRPDFAFAGGMAFTLHPGMAHDVTRLSVRASSGDPAPERLAIRYAVACEDQPLEEGTLIIPIQELG